MKDSEKETYFKIRALMEKSDQDEKAYNQLKDFYSSLWPMIFAIRVQNFVCDISDCSWHCSQLDGKLWIVYTSGGFRRFQGTPFLGCGRLRFGGTPLCRRK